MDKLNDLFTRIINKLNKKVDSVEGKGLSTEDFTTEKQTKLSGIEEEAQVNTIETISVNGTKVDPDEAKNVEIKAYNEDNKPEVGGRNLIAGTSDEWYTWGTYWSTPICKNIDIDKVGLKIGDTMTLSYELDVASTSNTDANIGAYLLSDDEEEIDYFSGPYIRNTHASYSINFKILENTKYLQVRYVRKNNSNGGPIKSRNIKLERGEVATDWSPAPEDLETTADNFEGILPIEKGGTGNTNGNAAPYGLRKVETKDQWGNREGTTLVEYDTPGHPLNAGGGLYLSEIPQSGYKLNITIDGWYYCNEGNDRVATLNEVSATQLALTSLYEARAVTTASADMPMGSPTIEGELTPLDKNMVRVYADLCLNPESGKTIDEVPEHLRAYVSNIVEETLAKRKEEEERYKAEMEKREEEERLKAELEAESAGDEYHDNEPLTE